MADIEFSWSPVKAAKNQKKHRVSFTEAQTVFYDEEALLLTTRTTPKARIVLYY